MKRRLFTQFLVLLLAGGGFLISGSVLAQDQTRDRLQIKDQLQEDADQDRDRIRDRDFIQDAEDAIKDRDRVRDQLDDPDRDRDRIHQ